MTTPTKQTGQVTQITQGAQDDVIHGDPDGYVQARRDAGFVLVSTGYRGPELPAKHPWYRWVPRDEVVVIGEK